jgi:hypothetical protein
MIFLSYFTYVLTLFITQTGIQKQSYYIPNGIEYFCYWNIICINRTIQIVLSDNKWESDLEMETFNDDIYDNVSDFFDLIMNDDEPIQYDEDDNENEFEEEFMMLKDLKSGEYKFVVAF